MIRANAVQRFLKQEDGAITVDWVVLSAAIIGIGLVVLMPIAFETENATDNIADIVVETPVGYTSHN
ncbi:MAG: hypothetical protein ACRC14_17640 [Paracoccaceae bacterium]